MEHRCLSKASKVARAACNVGGDVKVCKRPHKANTYVLKLKCVIGEQMILQSSIDRGNSAAHKSDYLIASVPKLDQKKRQHQIK